MRMRTDSAVVSTTVDVQSVNDVPVLTITEVPGEDYVTHYVEQSPSLAIVDEASVSLTDNDNSSLSQLVVTSKPCLPIQKRY